MLGIIFFVAYIYAGFILARLIKGLTLLERVIIGIIAGCILATWSSFLFFFLTGNINQSFWASLILAAMLCIFLTIKFKIYRKDFGKSLERIRNALRRNFTFLVFLVVLIVFISAQFSSHIIEPRSDGLYSGEGGSYWDLPLHLSLINHFRYGAGTLEFPMFPGERMTYSFLFDFFTAVLAGPGLMDLRFALIFSGILFSLVIALVVYVFALRLSRFKSVAFLTVVLFFLVSGMGHLYYIYDTIQKGTASQDYAYSGQYKLYWGSIIFNSLLPHRTFLIGFPTGMVILLLFLVNIDRPEKSQLGSKNTRLRFLVAGILAGALPMIHMHTFVAVMFVAAILASIFFSWSWLYFFIPVGVLGFPQFLWIFSRVSSGSFIRFQLGWKSQATNFLEFIIFWIKNTGIFIFMGIAGMFFVKKRIRLFLIPIWALFIICNIIVFQPHDYDNLKMILFWWVCIIILSSVVLVKLARIGNFWKIACLFFVLFSIFSGVMPVYLLRDYENRLFSNKGIEIANWAKEQTAPDAVFLTSEDHNNPIVALAGRRILMGYGFWKWGYGLNLKEREFDINKIFSGDKDAKKLLEKYGVDYIVIDQSLRSKGVNETYFEREFKLVKELDSYRVFEI